MKGEKTNPRGGRRDTAGKADLRSGPRRIVLAYDGSSGADATLEELVCAGLPDKLEAVVLGVAAKPGRERAAGLARSARPEHPAISRAVVTLGRRLAEQACARLRTLFPHWQLEAMGATNSVEGSLLRLTNEWQADLVVIGAYGESQIERMQPESVSLKLFAEAPCSVRIARPRLRRLGHGLRILVSLQGSPDDEAVIEIVAARCWPATTQFQIITVADERLAARQLAARSLTAAWRKQHSAVADARACQLVERYWNRLRCVGLNVDTLVFQGDRAGHLVAQATAWEADAVFLGDQGNDRRRGHPFDPVAFAVATCAPCSLEVVKVSDQVTGPHKFGPGAGSLKSANGASAAPPPPPKSRAGRRKVRP